MMKKLNTKTYDDVTTQYQLRMTQTGLKSALKLEQHHSSLSPLNRNRSSNLSKTHRDENHPYFRLNTDLNSSMNKYERKNHTVKKVTHTDSPAFIVEKNLVTGQEDPLVKYKS